MTNANFAMKSIQARWVLGIILSDDLPDIAIEALSAGIESRSLIDLAGLNRSETDEARKLFGQALIELGCQNMEKATALRHYAKIVSATILASDVTPFEGAKKIWQVWLETHLYGFHDLDGFIYAASEWEDRPEDKAFFEGKILEEAKIWNEFNDENR